jgi:nucleoside-diphosphate-sugar epimerase
MERFMNKVMIVGGAGYIGTLLSSELHDRGYDVSIVDLLWFGNNLPTHLKTKVRQADVFDLTQKDLEGFHSVVFIAGLSNDPMADYSPSKNFISNSASPAYLAYIARKAGVRRMVYASSCSVYGYAVDEFYDENGPTTAVYPYGISKLQGERSVVQMATDDFSVIALRKGTVSGVSPRMRFDLVVNSMFKSALTTNTITMSNPSIWRPILSIRDCVSAYMRAIESDCSISGVFNVASENCTVGTIADVVKATFEEELGTKPTIINNNVKDVRNYKVNCDRAATVLGFVPKYGLRNIVVDLIRNRDKFGDMNNPAYYNIKTFVNMETSR